MLKRRLCSRGTGIGLLHKMISESQSKGIAKEAKEILDKFAKSLDRVKLKGKAKVNGVGGYRKEIGGKVANEKFRKGMFENAPLVEGECIVAEKKSW